MKRLGVSVGLCGAVLAAVVSWNVAAGAPNKAQQAAVAATILKQALEREAREGVEDRSELLGPALVQEAKFEPALWQSGFIYDARQKEWLRYDEAREFASKDNRLAAYRKARADQADTLDGHLAIARWCASRQLDDQARAHLTRVLEFNPDHVEARQLLGFRLVNGAWVSEQEVADAQARVRQAAADLATWRPRLEKLRQSLCNVNRKPQEKAREELRAIRDPAAVGAIDAVFCARGGEDSLFGIALLEKLVSAESAATLARYAVFAPWEPIGHAAAKALRSQRKHDYVPLLLSGLRSPILSRSEVFESPARGFAFYRQVFYREDQDQQNLAVLDSTYASAFDTSTRPTIVVRPQVSVADAARLAREATAAATPEARRVFQQDRAQVEAKLLADASRQAAAVYRAQVPRGRQIDAQTQQVAADAARMRAAMRAAARDTSVAKENQITALINVRLSAVLQEATEEMGIASAENWWKWWYEDNECLPPTKAQRVVYQQTYLTNSLPSQTPVIETEMPSLPSPGPVSNLVSASRNRYP
jgi:hypothetical protein